MLHKVRILGVLAAALALASPALAQACQKDMDCPGDAICEGGQCIGEDGEPVGAAASAAPAESGAPASAATGTITLQVVDVEFLPRGGKPVLVTDTGTGQSCMAPCTLRLTPGTRRVKVGTSLVRPLLISSSGGRYTVSEPNGGLIAGGAALMGLGGGLLVPGLVFLLVGGSSEADEEDADSSLAGVGKILTLIGAPMFVIGLPMLIAADKGDIQSAHGPRRRYVAKRLAVLPYAQPRQGGGMLGVAFSF